jgi:hypothetical protein
VSEDEDGTTFFYDKDGMKRTLGIVKMWVTEHWGEEEKDNYIKKMTKHGHSIEGLENISYSQTLFEVNCKDEKFRILTDTSHDKEGRIIQNIQKGDWVYHTSFNKGYIEKKCV